LIAITASNCATASDGAPTDIRAELDVYYKDPAAVAAILAT
jgi:hypothetical protein